jgi:uncharacterized protein (TIGR02145 family)
VFTVFHSINENMDKIHRFIVLLLLEASILFTSGCKNEELPSVTTDPINFTTGSSTVCGGNVSTGGSKYVFAKGVCWSIDKTPTVDGNKTIDSYGLGRFQSVITGLEPRTTYLARAYATTEVGTAYGTVETFETLDAGQISDFEKNIYNTVTIGKQVWMKENLKAIEFSDGTPIQNVTDNNDWAALTTPAYCWFNNEINNKGTYGALYNLYTLDPNTNGKKKVCPFGWHVPSNDDWVGLINSIGGEIDGGKLKETGTLHWKSPNYGATNETGFSGLPAGKRHNDGVFYAIGQFGYWWDAPNYYANSANFYMLCYNNYYIFTINEMKNYGFSVRCVKD